MSKKTLEQQTPAAGQAPAAGNPAEGGAPEAGGAPDGQIDPNAAPAPDGGASGEQDDNKNSTTVNPVVAILETAAEQLRQVSGDTTPSPAADAGIVEECIERLREYGYCNVAKSDGDPDPTKTEPQVVPVMGICDAVTIVVCGTVDTIPLLTKAWKDKASGAHVIPLENADTPFHEAMARILAEDIIPDTFILVPANCFPTRNMNIADLLAFRLRLRDNGSKEHTTGLPVLIEATAALKAIELLETSEFTEEEFLEQYNGIARAGELPDEMSMSFGNIVAYVKAPNPCRSKVIEAMVRKKFICTSAEGFSAIKDLLAEMYE